jgi:hypothetical protein
VVERRVYEPQSASYSYESNVVSHDDVEGVKLMGDEADETQDLPSEVEDKRYAGGNTRPDGGGGYSGGNARPDDAANSEKDEEKLSKPFTEEEQIGETGREGGSPEGGSSGHNAGGGF